MALSDLFNFFTSDAKEKYNERSVNTAAIRKPLLTGIKRTRDDFKAEKFTKPNRWFSVKNEVVAFHPKLGGRTLTINGVDENHMPSGRFIEFLDLMEKEVEAGEFDEVIAAHGKGNVDVHIGKAIKPRSPSKPSTSKLPARADGLPHRPLASEPKPHPSYTLNTGKTHWRSPEQVAKDAASYANRSKKA